MCISITDMMMMLMKCYAINILTIALHFSIKYYMTLVVITNFVNMSVFLIIYHVHILLISEHFRKKSSGMNSPPGVVKCEVG